jgi:NAD(P)-dependent dehydrogenase (short-subunit alcohol dehydrogenase family)
LKYEESKICVITGGNSGIGKETAKILIRENYRIVLMCRNLEKAEAAQTELMKASPKAAVDIIELDLASLESVRKAAEKFNQRYHHLDILMNNAGLIWGNSRATSQDGFEMSFAVNHLGHFLLTYLLLPKLKSSSSARILNVSSEAHRIARFKIDDLQLGNHKYNGLNAYAISKLCNIWFTTKLAQCLDKDNITVNALHPGVVASNFGSSVQSPFAFLFGIIKPFAISSAKAARLPAYLASNERVKGSSGLYFKNFKVSRPSRAALNPSYADGLWAQSEELCGISWICD